MPTDSTVESHVSTVKQLENWCSVKWLKYLLHKLQVGSEKVAKIDNTVYFHFRSRILVSASRAYTSFYLDKYQFKLSVSDINTAWYTGNVRFLLLMAISMNIDHCRLSSIFTKWRITSKLLTVAKGWYPHLSVLKDLLAGEKKIWRNL